MLNLKSDSRSVVESTDTKVRLHKQQAIMRRFMVAPIDVREFRLGHAVELPTQAADLLIAGGFATLSRKEPRTSEQKLLDLAGIADTVVDNETTLDDNKLTTLDESAPTGVGSLFKSKKGKGK